MGTWDDITFDNIYGDFAFAGVSFYENHGGSPAHNPPTNASATPVIRNLAVRNVVLSVVAPSMLATLAEAPIENLTLSNITLTPAKRGARVGWECPGANGTTQVER